MIVQFFNFFYIYKKIKVRSERYLCFKSQLIQSSNYIEKIKKIDNQILKLQTLLIIPILTKKIKWIIETIQIYQQFEHFSYLKNIIKDPLCDYINKTQLLYKLPFKTNLGKLARDYKGITIKRSQKWVLKNYGHLPFELNALLKISRRNSLLKTREVAKLNSSFYLEF